MTSRLVSLVLDANDPTRLAHFWSVALGWEVAQHGDEIGLTPPDGTACDILFEPVAETKTGQNRVHLDLTTTSADDQRETVRGLLELGARHIDIGQLPDETHVVLADPEGNEFCVLAPGNNFLAGCGRLGAINCDGTRGVGVFWSEVFGWPLVWDEHEETAIRAPFPLGPMITWSGPPLIPKHGKNRLHLDIAPVGTAQHTEVERLLALGASKMDVGQGDVAWVVMTDADGNEFCVLSPQ